jgi:hypothetical protein
MPGTLIEELATLLHRHEVDPLVAVGIEVIFAEGIVIVGWMTWARDNT